MAHARPHRRRRGGRHRGAEGPPEDGDGPRPAAHARPGHPSARAAARPVGQRGRLDPGRERAAPRRAGDRGGRAAAAGRGPRRPARRRAGRRRGAASRGARGRPRPGLHRRRQRRAGRRHAALQPVAGARRGRVAGGGGARPRRAGCRGRRSVRGDHDPAADQGRRPAGVPRRAPHGWTRRASASRSRSIDIVEPSTAGLVTNRARNVRRES
ncbi:MAG: hypothetical protein MZV64_13590 [Ignavibacteriales bacterium]|nr:hypothetical protein [Ignavibacteriales bacterium]